MLRALDDQTPLHRYLELKGLLRELTAEMKALEPEILCALMDEDSETAECLGFELRVCRRLTYDYSPRVEQMQQELKALKKLEEASGAARIRKHTCYVQARALPPSAAPVPMKAPRPAAV